MAAAMTGKDTKYQTVPEISSIMIPGGYPCSFFVATRENHLKMAQWLLNQPHLDNTDKQYDGESVLHKAVARHSHVLVM